MTIWARIILSCATLIMRVCVKMLKKESTNDNEYCWLENSVTELERLIKDKL